MVRVKFCNFRRDGSRTLNRQRDRKFRDSRAPGDFAANEQQIFSVRFDGKFQNGRAVEFGIETCLGIEDPEIKRFIARVANRDFLPFPRCEDKFRFLSASQASDNGSPATFRNKNDPFRFGLSTLGYCRRSARSDQE